MQITARRLLDRPIIDQALDASLGDNINGPSLVAAPAWLSEPRGRYYLYFAHHEGRHIRLAFADHLTGPWRIHAPGALHLAETSFPQIPPALPQPAWAAAKGVDGLYPHIASPDVHCDPGARAMRMYFHGLDHDGEQRSLVASSRDGISWEVGKCRIDQAYLRVFGHRGRRHALALGGQVLREGHRGFEPGPWLFPRGHRHAAVLLRGDLLHVLWTRIGDAPERILHTAVDLRPDWSDWRAGTTAELLRPELPWEGADQPVRPSEIGTAARREKALRDPCLFEEDGRLFLIYAGAGETALGLAEIFGL